MAGLDTEADQEGRSQHDEGDMAIPTDIATHFIVIQAQTFAGLQILFNVPTSSNSLHDGGQGSRLWGKDQVIRQLVWVVQAPKDHQPVSSVHCATMEHRQDRPIKKPL